MIFRSDLEWAWVSVSSFLMDRDPVATVAAFDGGQLAEYGIDPGPAREFIEERVRELAPSRARAVLSDAPDHALHCATLETGIMLGVLAANAARGRGEDE